MQRVAVVGNSGSGKTTTAERLAGHLGVHHIELDSLFMASRHGLCVANKTVGHAVSG